MTPIFSRSWLMNTTAQFDRLMAPASLAVAHFTFDFLLGHQRRHRVDDHQVHRTGPHQDLHDLERLLSGVRLGHQQVVDIHTQLLGVLDIEGVLRVHVGRHPAGALDIGREVKSESGLAGRLRPVDFGDPAPGNAPDADGRVQVDGSGGNGLDPLSLALRPHPHDRTLAQLLLDLGDGQIERLTALGVQFGFLDVGDGHENPSNKNVDDFASQRYLLQCNAED
jgi:hypothetical protein